MRKIFNSQGTMAMGSMVILIGTILTTSASAAVIMSTAQSSEDQATAVVNDTMANLCDGLMVIDATGHYIDNRLTSLDFIMRPSPGSNPIDLEDIIIIVITETNETVYTLGSNSTNVFLTHTFNGDNDTVVSRGDLMQLTIPDLDLAVGEEIIIKMVPSMGQTITMSFTVPDSLGNGLVVFE